MNILKCILIISISIIIGCSASNFISNEQKLRGKWKMIFPYEITYLGGYNYKYYFKADSFFVARSMEVILETFKIDFLHHVKDVDEGSGTYYLLNDKIYFIGFYTENYFHKTIVEYSSEGETIYVGEVVKDTIYNQKQIKIEIDEEYSYRFKGDTLILDCDKKYLKRYFVREQ